MGSDMLRPLLETLQVERESTRYLGPVRASLAGPGMTVVKAVELFVSR